MALCRRHLLIGDNLLIGQGHLHGALHEDGLGKSLEIWALNFTWVETKEMSEQNDDFTC